MRGAVDDISRVIEATSIHRPILVGWSHGATIAVRYAAQHPERVAGLVLIDGAYPIAMFDEAGKQKVRAQFHRLRWIMRILAALGRSARMSPAEAEASNKRVSVFATTPYNHMQILNKAPDTVVAAIEDVIHHSS